MVGSFESQVLTQAKRFETLGAGSAKTLDTPADGRNRAASADQGGHSLERRGAAADRRGIAVCLQSRISLASSGETL